MSRFNPTPASVPKASPSCDARRPALLPDPLRPSILLARDRSGNREITVPDAHAVVLLVTRDVINRRRMLILAGFAALALASMLTGIALGGS